MCMCLGSGRVGDEWMRELCLGITNPVGTKGVWDVCLYFGCDGGGCVGGGWGESVVGLNMDLGGWGCVLYVCVVSLDYLCRWQV